MLFDKLIKNNYRFVTECLMIYSHNLKDFFCLIKISVFLASMLKTRLFSHEFRGLNLWNTTERIFLTILLFAPLLFSKKRTMLVMLMNELHAQVWHMYFNAKEFFSTLSSLSSFNAVSRPRIHFSPLPLNNVPPNNTELGSCLGIPWFFNLTSMELLVEL